MVTFDHRDARLWTTPPPPGRASAEAIEHASAVARGARWIDPAVERLGLDPFDDVVRRIVGRGPGLTPAGDDVLLGYLAARRERGLSARVLVAARRATTGPSLALLRWAARGELPEPAATTLAALLTGDIPALTVAIRALLRFGETTGSAILTGLIAGVRDYEASPPTSPSPPASMSPVSSSTDRRNASPP